MGKVKLQLLTTTEDTKDNIVTFTSGDTANPTAWKDVATLASKEKHSSLLNKISTMFNNIRYLYKILGTTDISALGTVTQAIATIKGNIGDMKGISSSTAITTQGQYALDAREKNASVDGTLANQISNLNSNLQYKIYKNCNAFGLVESEALTTEEIISQMPEFSILIKALWRESYPNMHFSDATSDNRCIYTIIKSLEGYSLVKHFEVGTGNMYICGYYDNRFSDWHSI